MAEEGWPGEQGHERQGPPVGSLVAQIFLALFAFLTFLWLINILLEHGQDPVWASLADAASRNAWVAICLVVLAIILIIEVLLLRPAMREAVLDKEAWTPAPVRNEPAWHDDNVHHAPEHLLGCPGCGTVFDANEHGADTDGSFSCPNCGRMGRLRTRAPVQAAVNEIDCPRCAHHYQAYQAESECPKCGQHIKLKAG